MVEGDGDGGPYRVPGDTRLGHVLRRFEPRRRPRYLGSANAVGAPPFITVGGFLPSMTHATQLSGSRRSSGEAVEVCERGFRVLARAGVLELMWDQVTGVRRIDDAAGLAAIVVSGVHGEEVTLDRSLRDLGELATAVEHGFARQTR